MTNILQWYFWYISPQCTSKLETLSQYFPESKLVLAHTNCFHSGRKIMVGKNGANSMWTIWSPKWSVYFHCKIQWKGSGSYVQRWNLGRRQGHTESPGTATMTACSQWPFVSMWLATFNALCFSLWKNENPFQYFKIKIIDLISHNCLQSYNFLPFSFV